MNWEVAVLKDGVRLLNRRLKCEHRDGVKETLRRYPNDTEAQAFLRYVETFLTDDDTLIRN